MSRRPPPDAWSRSEEQIVLRLYPAGGPDACVPLLPGRSRSAIVNRAIRLRVRMTHPRAGARGDFSFSARPDPSPASIAFQAAAIRAANDERLLQSAGPVWAHAAPRTLRCRDFRTGDLA